MPTRTSIAGAALAAALSCATAAHADTVDLVPGASGGYSATFASTVDGLFIDTYDFAPAGVSGLVSVMLKGVAGQIGFFSATLNGVDFSYFPESGARSFTFQTTVTADVPLELTVFGSTLAADGNVGGAGSYRGSLTVAGVTAAVPEAQTWALLLAGLGLTGLAAARGRPGHTSHPLIAA